MNHHLRFYLFYLPAVAGITASLFFVSNQVRGGAFYPSLLWLGGFTVAWMVLLVIISAIAGWIIQYRKVAITAANGLRALIYIGSSATLLALPFGWWLPPHFDGIWEIFLSAMGLMLPLGLPLATVLLWLDWRVLP